MTEWQLAGLDTGCSPQVQKVSLGAVAFRSLPRVSFHAAVAKESLA